MSSSTSFLNFLVVCCPESFEHLACFDKIALALFLAFPPLRPILVEILHKFQQVFFPSPETSHVVFGLDIMAICAIIENAVKNAGLHQQYDIRCILSELLPERLPVQFQDDCMCSSCFQSNQEHKLLTLICPVCASMICEECYTSWKKGTCPCCRKKALYEPQLPLSYVLHLWGQIIFFIIFGKNVKEFPSVLDHAMQHEIFSKIVSFMSEHLGIQIEVPSDNLYSSDFLNEDEAVVEVTCVPNESDELTSFLLSRSKTLVQCDTLFQCVIYAADDSAAGAAGASGAGAADAADAADAAGAAGAASADDADDRSAWYD